MLRHIPGYSGILIEIEEQEEVPTAIVALRYQLDSIDSGHPFLVMLDDVIEAMDEELE